MVLTNCNNIETQLERMLVLSLLLSIVPITGSTIPPEAKVCGERNILKDCSGAKLPEMKDGHHLITHSSECLGISEECFCAIARGDHEEEDGVTEDLLNDFEALLMPVEESEASPFDQKHIVQDLFKRCKMDDEMLEEFLEKDENSEDSEEEM